MNNIVNTPVRLELAENRIGLDESNLLTSLMENNTYYVKIHTNEILDGCNLVMKRYGDKTSSTINDLITITNPLRPEVIKLIKINKILFPKNQTSTETELKVVNYWGIARLYNDNNTDTNISDDVYRVEMYQYAIRKQFTEIPLLEKQQEVYLEKVGDLFGKIYFQKSESTENSKDEYKFKPTKVKYVNSENEIEFAEDYSEQIVFEEYYDTTLIPEPPKIDDELIVPDKISFSSKITLDTENNENFDLEFKNFELDFSSYDDEEKFYYFRKVVEFSEIIKGNKITENEGQPDEETTIKTEISDNLFVSNVTFKYDEELSENTDEENYKSVSGNFTVVLKFPKEDFSAYDFEIVGNISFIIEDAVPEVTENGEYLYQIPVMSLLSKTINGIKLDGDGEPKKEKVNYELLYETYKTVDNEGKEVEVFILDENGLKIPRFLKKEGLLLDNENNAIREEREPFENESLPLKPKYEMDLAGNFIYEYFLIPVYKRNEDTKELILDDQNKPQYIYLDEEETQIKYEQNYDGSYIYDKRIKPIYELDEEGRKKIVNGEYVIEYETDEDGVPVVDLEGKISLYETYKTEDDEGKEVEVFVLDENGLKIPIYQRGIVFALNSEGRVEQERVNLEEEKEIDKVVYQVDSEGQIIYEQFLIPKYKRNENGELELVDNKVQYIYSENGEKEYETQSDGNYFYFSKPLPVYILDENGDRKIENGEYKVEYERNGTKTPLRDENGKLIPDESTEGKKYKLEDGEVKELLSEEIGYYEIEFLTNSSLISRKENQEENQEESLNLAEDEYRYEENLYFTSNFLPKYEVNFINEEEYYKTEEVEQNRADGTEGNRKIEAVPKKVVIFDDKGAETYLLLKPVIEDGEIIYEVNSDGENELIEGFKQIMTLGENEEAVQINYSTINNINISYEGFGYIEKAVDKNNFVEEVEENHIYTTFIESKELPDYTEKIALGVVKYNSEDSTKIDYVTSEVELGVERSIKTFAWDADETFSNQKYVLAYYDEETNSFCENIPNSDPANNIYLSGRENYIYIDTAALESKTVKDLLYKWNPETGFYKLNSVTNKIIK